MMTKFGKRLNLGSAKSQSQCQPVQTAQKVSNDPQDPCEQAQHSFETSMALNLKEHIDKLESILMCIKDELKITKSEMGKIKEDLTKIKVNQYSEEDKITKTACETTTRLFSELKGQSGQTRIAHDSFGQQVTVLYKDRDFLCEGGTNINLKTNLVETHVGFRRVYD